MRLKRANGIIPGGLQISRRDLIVIQCLIFAANEQVGGPKGKQDLDVDRISRAAPHYARGYSVRLTPGEAELAWNRIATALATEKAEVEK